MFFEYIKSILNCSLLSYIGQHCGDGYFKCLYSDGCILNSKVCNGVADCVDRTDEGPICGYSNGK